MGLVVGSMDGKAAESDQGGQTRRLQELHHSLQNVISMKKKACENMPTRFGLLWQPATLSSTPLTQEQKSEVTGCLVSRTAEDWSSRLKWIVSVHKLLKNKKQQNLFLTDLI